jgi:hypothetical protein
MVALMIVLIIFAVILFMGMIADKDIENRRNFTYGFCTVILAIVAIVVFKM